MSDENGWLGVIAGVLTVGAALITLAAATKTCPCCGTAMPFQSHCERCGHQH